MINYIPENIKYLRKREKLSQGDLAVKLDKTQSTISCWESGKRDIVLADAFILCNYFNIPLEDFIGRDLKLFYSDSVNNKNEKKILSLYRSLTPPQQEAIIKTMEAMVG